jgi:glyoxylase-like metal-dependent hydrolase (beta-lactamase superfamily II)
VSEHASGKQLQIECLTLGPLSANCYLITDTPSRQTIVVDPGFAAERILERLRALDTNVASIVHTHGHVDHISATEAVLAGLGRDVLVAAHPNDTYLYAPAERQRGTEWGYLLPATLCTPSVELRDGDEIELGAARLRVIHTPGHTPGGICLLAGEEFVLSGDTLFRRGIGRTDLLGGDEDAIYESILTRLYTLPPELVVYPGHGPSTTIGDERRENPFVRAEGM